MLIYIPLCLIKTEKNLGLGDRLLQSFRRQTFFFITHLLFCEGVAGALIYRLEVEVHMLTVMKLKGSVSQPNYVN